MAPHTWQFALDAYIPLVNANMSVVGSSLIIYSILVPGRKTKLRQPHFRILLAMSFYDLGYSLVRAWTFLLAPKGYGVPGAQGNMATCRMQAFFIQTTRATAAYYALLSFYYWLTICRGVKNHVFAKYEPIAHVLIFIVFVGFAIAGVAIRLFNPVFSFCYIAPYPRGCETGPDSPECDYFSPRETAILYEIFGQIWPQVFMVVVIITQASILLNVRKQEKKMLSYGHNCTPSGIEQKKKKLVRTKQVATQSTLYILAFISCWIGPTLYHIASWATGFKAFWALMIITIFTPLQGFWNCIVFARPTYVRLKNKYPNIGRFEIVGAIFLYPDPTERAKTCNRSCMESKSNTHGNDACGEAPKFGNEDDFVDDNFINGEDDEMDEHQEAIPTSENAQEAARISENAQEAMPIPENAKVHFV